MGRYSLFLCGRKALQGQFRANHCLVISYLFLLASQAITKKIGRKEAVMEVNRADLL
jgi:hypothetical protein